MCAPIRGYWSATINPFPRVNATQKVVGGEVPRMKVTMHTAFSVLRNTTSGVDAVTAPRCELSITPLEGSVRIDGLYARSAIAADAKNAALVRRKVPAQSLFALGSTQDRQWRFARRATMHCE